jgi:translation initiation factor IF-1
MKPGDIVLIRRFVLDDTRPVRWFRGEIVRATMSEYSTVTRDRFDVRLDDGSMIINACRNSMRAIEEETT